MFLYVVRVSAETYTVGVKVDDWAKYRDTCLWSSEDPNAIEPAYYKELKNREWRKLTVQAISYTTITVSVATRFKNDTQKTDVYISDVAAGSGDSEFGWQIIPSGLSKGDRISQNPRAIILNDTMSKEFAGATREANYAGFSIEVEGVTLFEYYWDKQSGILCAMLTYDISYSEGYRTETLIHTEILETNLWQAEADGDSGGIELWQVIIVVIVISAVLLIVRSKHKSRRRK